MRSFNFTIRDKNGLHARPSGLLASTSKRFLSKITIRNGEKVADGKRLLSVMTLGARCGHTLEFIIEGSDEESAEDALKTTLGEMLNNDN